jgi:Tfp pilus assembly protein PilF
MNKSALAVLLLGNLAFADTKRYSTPGQGRVDPAVTSAIELLNRGDLKGAESALQAVLQKKPNSVGARAALAEVRFRQNRPLEADAPKNAELLRAYGRFLVTQKRLTEAEQRLRQSVESAGSVPSFIDLGELYLGTDKNAEAAATFRKAVAADSTNVPARLGLATSLARSKQPAEAEQVLLETSKLSPSNPAPHLLLGALYRERGQPDRALEAYGRAIKLDPRSQAAHVARGDIFASRSQLSHALTEYERAVTAGRDAAEIRIRIGMVNGQLGKTAAAEEAYRSAIRLDSAAVVAYNNLANLLMHRKQQNAEAETLARKAVALRPDAVDFHDTLASVLEARGDVRGAIQVLEKALAGKTQPEEASRHLAALRAKAGKPQAAGR